MDRVRARLETVEGLERSNFLWDLLYEMGEWSAEEVEQFLADENLLRAALAVHPDALGAAVAATTPETGILVLEKLTADPARLVMKAFFTKLAEKS